ncbi:MAG TPA: biosynthetic peptidoglycan transglycosylase, partial [Solirubrobacteraceae bacterium]|nr:biosynthetic peptidoglycan transglycosylase [Solirubrobacteraceae bacterium]
MSEDDRRHTYEDPPSDGDLDHAAAAPNGNGNGGAPAEDRFDPYPPHQPNGEPAPDEYLDYPDPYYADAPVGAADFGVDAGGPGSPDGPAVPTAVHHEGDGLGAPPSAGGRRRKPRLKKLRLLIVLLPLALLALVSAVFGMIMAIASDLPALENRAEYKSAQNSILLDINGKQIGVLTGQDNRILVKSTDIPSTMKEAMIAVEDKRFYTNSGIDIKGIARAFVADVFKQRAAQGASTITQQFVKNALQAQSKRTVFEKLREAALAYHLTRKWTKDKILTEYLNSIYFGNGAYGIESAARTYFGHDQTTSQYNCGTTGMPLCVKGLVAPEEAALIAGVVASPTAYDPIAHPVAARNRRNLVLRDMYAQGYL